MQNSATIADNVLKSLQGNRHLPDKDKVNSFSILVNFYRNYLSFYLELTGSFKYSLDIWVCKVGTAGVGIFQEQAHRPTVQPLYLHTLLMTLPQTTAKHCSTHKMIHSVKQAVPTQWSLTILDFCLPEILTCRCKYGSMAMEVISLNTQHHIGQFSVHS